MSSSRASIVDGSFANPWTRSCRQRAGQERGAEHASRAAGKQIGAVARLSLIVGIVVLVVGCGATPETAGEQPAAPLSIECQVFYRPSVAQSPGEGTTITLTGQGDRGVVEYDDMVLSARFSDDQFEGPSLSISVAARPDDQITSQLYQIDRAKGLSNQFVGGHGFTGLIYVYHPTSPSEIQYFCQARQGD